MMAIANAGQQVRWMKYRFNVREPQLLCYSNSSVAGRSVSWRRPYSRSVALS